MDNEFWSNHDTQNTTLQIAFLFHIITEYNSIIYDKSTYYISFFGNKTYIQKIMTSAHL